MREPPLNTTESRLSSFGSTIPYTSIMPSKSPSGALIVMLPIIRYKFGIKLWSDFGIELITDLTVHTRLLGWYKLFDILPKVNWYTNSFPGLGVIIPGKLGADINFQSPKLSDEYADLTVRFKAAKSSIALIISGFDVSPKCLQSNCFNSSLRNCSLTLFLYFFVFVFEFFLPLIKSCNASSTIDFLDFCFLGRFFSFLNSIFSNLKSFVFLIFD